jgi:hypothetical protein
MPSLADRTQIPACLFEDSEETWEVLLTLAESIRETNSGRWYAGALFDTPKWTPGCGLCVIGAVAEDLLDTESLKQLNRSDPYAVNRILAAYETRYGLLEDPMSFSMASVILMRLNDAQQMRFADIYTTIKEAYDENVATRGSVPANS